MGYEVEEEVYGGKRIRKRKVIDVPLVEISPIEFQQRAAKDDKLHHRHPRIIRFYDISFNPHLDQNMISRIVREMVFKNEPILQTNPDYFAIWQYPNQPQIYLSREGRFFVSEDTLSKYTLAPCQKQVSHIIKILKKYGMVKYRTVSITDNPSVMGRTDEELEETLEAIRNLRNKTWRKQVKGWEK
jgi:hypothetical protein